MLRSLVCVVLLTALANCSPTYQQTRLGAEGSKAGIPPGSTVFVGWPADGRYGQIVYHGSGYKTADSLAMAFGAAVKDVERSSAFVDRKEGLAQARAGGFDYYVEPKILHWEDRNTAWSGRSDVIIIQITVLDATTGDEIDSTTIYGKSPYFTFTNEPPEDMLAEPMNKYVVELVQ